MCAGVCKMCAGVCKICAGVYAGVCRCAHEGMPMIKVVCSLLLKVIHHVPAI